MHSSFSRRTFLQSAALITTAGVLPSFASSSVRGAFALDGKQGSDFLEEFGYGDVSIHSAIHEEQLRQTHAVLMGLDDDALMKPFRAMVGQPAPGEDLGGWYRYDPNYDWHTFDAGFA